MTCSPDRVDSTVFGVKSAVYLIVGFKRCLLVRFELFKKCIFRNTLELWHLYSKFSLYYVVTFFILIIYSVLRNTFADRFYTYCWNTVTFHIHHGKWRYVRVINHARSPVSWILGTLFFNFVLTVFMSKSTVLGLEFHLFWVWMERILTELSVTINQCSPLSPDLYLGYVAKSSKYQDINLSNLIWRKVTPSTKKS